MEMNFIQNDLPTIVARFEKKMKEIIFEPLQLSIVIKYI